MARMKAGACILDEENARKCKSTFNGKYQLLVRAAQEGEIEIGASSEGLEEARCVIKVNFQPLADAYNLTF